MKDTIFIKEVTVEDTTDNNSEVKVTIFKDINSGGLFGIDSCFIEQNFEDDEEIKVIEPINGRTVILDI
jgi:hypothetical protein